MKDMSLIALLVLFCGNCCAQDLSHPSYTYCDRALEHYDHGQYNKALIAIDSALSLNSQEPYFYDVKSFILISMQEFDQAGRVIDLALTKFPTDPYTHCTKGDYDFFMAEPERALLSY